jgi:lysophospholipase L1-like esterase
MPTTGGYVPLLAGRLSTALGCSAGSAPGCPLELRNLARSGATTATLLRDQLPRALEVLRSADVRLVTLTIGGNDVVEPVVRACALAPQTQTCGAAVVASLRNADEGIEEVLRTVRDAVGPDTPVAVMTYYNPLPACQFASLQPLADQVLEGTSGQSGLNDVLRMRAAQYGALVVDTGDRLSAPADFVGGGDCLHPSGPGHARIAAAFFDVVGGAVTRPAREGSPGRPGSPPR